MIKIGTSGFSFPDWIKTVYPQVLEQSEWLSYYQSHYKFNTVEINSTYYTLVSDKTFSGMEKKTGKGFEFIVKGYKGFTHDPFDTRLETKPSMEQVKGDIDKFIYSIQPLKSANKLGAVLLQFPVFFYPTNQSRDYLLLCREKFNDIPLIIEFRNFSWDRNDTFAFLEINKMGYCIVDEPNSFIPEVQKMAKKSGKTFVFFNNCHAGQAVHNAMQLRELLLKN